MPRFDDAKQVLSPSPHAPIREEQAWLHLGCLSRKVFEFWGFWFTLCSVLGLKGVFVTAETEVCYGEWRKHTSGGLSDTFQTTGRQSDFRLNHRWVMCNYPLYFSIFWLNLFYIFSGSSSTVDGTEDTFQNILYDYDDEEESGVTMMEESGDYFWRTRQFLFCFVLGV